jgi:hypothetical protein
MGSEGCYFQIREFRDIERQFTDTLGNIGEKGDLDRFYRLDGTQFILNMDTDKGGIWLWGRERDCSMFIRKQVFVTKKVSTFYRYGFMFDGRGVHLGEILVF